MVVVVGGGSYDHVCSRVLKVNRAALMKRYEQGWLMEWTDCVDACLDRVRYGMCEVSAVCVSV